MKKRIQFRAICLALSVAILAGALTVSAINGSPYENLKNAALNALFYDNVTIEVEFTLRVDGQAHERGWLRTEIGDESTLTHTSYERLWQSDNTVPITVTDYESQNLRISSVSITPLLDRQWYRVSRNNRVSASIGYQMFGVSSRNSNQVRFVELLVDLLVGDLKNNLTISPQSDDTRRVSGAITESQLPEIARIFIAMAIEEQLSWANRNPDSLTRRDFDNILEIPIADVSIHRIAGDADVDRDGNLVYASIRAHVTAVNMFGDSFELEAEVTLRFSDIGTTVPEPPFQEAEIFAELFEASEDDDYWWSLFEASGTDWEAPDLFWGWGWWSMYFTLDDDGNIDLSSIGTRPGHHDPDLRTVIETMLENRELHREPGR